MSSSQPFAFIINYFHLLFSPSLSSFYLSLILSVAPYSFLPTPFRNTDSKQDDRHPRILPRHGGWSAADQWRRTSRWQRWQNTVMLLLVFFFNIYLLPTFLSTATFTIWILPFLLSFPCNLSLPPSFLTLILTLTLPPPSPIPTPPTCSFRHRGREEEILQNPYTQLQGEWQ